jgi:hypothetical protein
MLILFILAVIFYALIGFKAFKLTDLRGDLFWSKMIFFCTVISVAVAYCLLMIRVPETINNIILVSGFIPGLVYAFKYYKVNLYKFQPASVVHVIYIWGAASIILTLLLELLPFGSNAKMMDWGFSGGLVLGIVLIVILFLPKKGNSNISQ